MKQVLSLLFVLTMAITVSAQVKKFETAVAYNDFIVDEQAKIGSAINEFITVFTSSKDTTELFGALKALTSQVDSSIKQLKQAMPFQGDTSLKNNSIRLFSFYLKAALNEYKQLIRLSCDTKKATEEKNNEMAVVIKKITDAEAIYDKNFQDAQIAFAAKHNFKLAENEMKIKD